MNPKGWALRTIESVCDRVTSGGTPSRRIPSYYEDGTIPWFKTGELQDKLLYDSDEHITREALDSSSAKIFPVDTVLMAMYGDGDTITNLGLLRTPAATNQACCAMIANPEICDSRFLFYALKQTRDELLRVVVGGAQRNLSGTIIRQHRIPVPPLAQQKRIAHILGTLDDKIELNRRMNATLEAMARALFQSWFVDFDPVRAKAAGQTPAGMDPATAALFPSEFDDSELGEIPKGWNTISLYESARFINGAAFKNSDFCEREDGLPVVKIAELKDGITGQTKFSRRPTDADRMIDTADLLYSWSGSPDTSLDAFLWTGGPGLLNQHIFKVVAATPAEMRFVYYLLKHLRPILIATAKDKQTTGLGHVTVADMKRLRVCLPSKKVLSKFDQLVSPVFDRAFATMIESRTLAALRAALLPKLLSGELTVGDTGDTIRRPNEVLT